MTYIASNPILVRVAGNQQLTVPASSHSSTHTNTHTGNLKASNRPGQMSHSTYVGKIASPAVETS